MPSRALRQAVAGFRAAGNHLVYPVGTLLMGQHLNDEGGVLETTIKKRRADGFWDFAVYDAEGRLVGSTMTEPRPLRAPVQCTGCHLGRRLFQPEQSFPAHASDGPFGPRDYLVPEGWRSAEATALFDEHARRDDSVLGLYGTLYTARLLAERQSGQIAPEDAALLDGLGL